jgi:predicted TIM-barrel fold metal-dependent hydrolase
MEVIDSDGHIMEPPDLWAGTYMDREYRERGPILSLNDGHLYWQDGAPFPAQGSFAAVESENALQPRLGGSDPDARIEDLDIDEIDATVIYPTVGLAHGHVEDPDLAAAMARGYNRWLAEWTSAHPDRLVGSAMLPVQSVERAIEELLFARNELGFKTAFLRPHVYKGRPIHSPEWDPFWAEAQDLNCPIGFHGGGAWPTLQAGEDRFSDGSWGPNVHVVIHPFEQQLALVGLMQAAVFERFPRLRVAFLESGGGWIVPLLERLERHYDQFWLDNSRAVLKQRPWDYFHQNCWIAFEPIEHSLGLVADLIGPNNILWATDYPHSDGFFPGAPKMIEKALEGTSEATRRGVLGGGARSFYNL